MMTAAYNGNDADEDYKMVMMMTFVPANQAYFSLPNIFKEFPVLRIINMVRNHTKNIRTSYLSLASVAALVYIF